MAPIKNIFVFLAVFFSCFYAFVPEIYADTHTAGSCSYSDVSKAITAASSGDTVMVPAGSCTWTSGLTITKGISLIGAGIGNTNITSNYTGEFLIIYVPSDFSANHPFRISGFTFDFAGKCRGIHLDNSSSLVPQTKVRIDHNRFLNPTNQALVNAGMRGVVDNNTFDTIAYPIRAEAGQGRPWWDNWTFIYGQADSNMYFEDNTFTGINNPVSDCQYGNRYAFRYNTITIISDRWPLWDLHGNAGGGESGMYSCFGGELYGNQIIGNYSVRLEDQRGGKMLIFYNSHVSSNYEIQVREEYADSLNPTKNPQPQHVSNSYYWANYGGGTLFSVYEAGRVGDIPLENRDYWKDARIDGGKFDGTVGVGCGTIAQMNAITTCTEGVGFWATNQSCSNLTGLVGANPSTPISGILYVCGASNNWVPYYTPLTYPHPLRGAPNPPQNLRIVK